MATPASSSATAPSPKPLTLEVYLSLFYQRKLNPDEAVDTLKGLFDHKLSVKEAMDDIALEAFRKRTSV